MKCLQDCRVDVATIPVSVNGATTPIAYIDTQGFDEAMFIVHMGATGTAGPSVLNVTEGDTTTPATTISPSTEMSGATFVTAGSLVLINLDLRKRKRYLRLNATTGGTTIFGATCVLFHGKQTPLGGANRTRFTAGGAVAGDTTNTLIV